MNEHLALGDRSENNCHWHITGKPLNQYSTLTCDVWMGQQLTLHLKCTDLVATALDDINTAATHDPIYTIFVDHRVSLKTRRETVHTK